MLGAGASGRSIQAQLQPPLIFVLWQKFLVLHDERVEARLRHLLADPTLTVVMPDEGKHHSAVITWFGSAYAVFSVPSAVPREEFTTVLYSPSTDQAAMRAVRKHQAHTVISPLTPPHDMGAAITQSVHLMQLAQAIGEMGGAPMGYFWVHSKQLRTSDEFNILSGQTLEALIRHRQGAAAASEGLPMSFWVGINLFSRDADRAGITQGLVAFAGYELEVTFLPWPESEVYLHIANCVAYLFAHGPVFFPGQKIGVGPNHSFSISLEPADDSRPATLVLGLESHGSSEEGS